MGESGSDLDLAQLRGNLDLLLRAQRLGKTGYVVSDVKADRVYWSDSLFEQRKIARRPFFTIAEGRACIHPDDLAGFNAQRERAMTDRQPFEHEMRIICGDGSIIWERGQSQPQFDAQGNFAGLLSVVDDITETKNVAASLKEQAAAYRSLFDSIGDAIFLMQGGVFVECNRIALEMFGATREQMIGSTPKRYSPERQPDGQSSAQKADAMIVRALAGERHSFEWRHMRQDGSEFDAEVTLNRVEGSAESYFFGVVRDISERKKAERALKASHDKFAGAFNSSNDAMLVLATGEEPGAGLILEANDSVRKIFGRDRNDLIGRTILEAGVQIPLKDVMQIRRQLLEDGFARDLPIRIVHPNGRTVDAEVSGAQFESGGERLSIVTIRDVSERHEKDRRIRELNEELETNLRQLRAIADNLPVAITYQDVEGRFLFTNKTAETWFATAEGGMLGRTVRELVAQDYLDALGPIRERLQAELTKIEGTVPYPDGKTRVVEATVVYDKNPDGSPRGRYTLLIDLTERKAQEDQLRQSQKMQAVGRLTGGVAHDFNNLLAVIAGNLDLAAEALGNTNKRVSQLLEPAQRAAERGSTLTRSLLAFSRQQPLSPQIADLNHLVRDMTELLRRTTPSNIDFAFVGDAGLRPCEVDPGQLQNALLNLVVNARDAMPEGGKLTIETRSIRIDGATASAHGDLTPGQYVVLAVSDTGSGMPPEVVARAFEPFFTTKDLGQGTGLGLSMVYGFAKQSDGHVAIRSEAGIGTTVEIYLPCWAGQVEFSAPQTERDGAAAPNATLLVVEDDEDMRFVAVTMLRTLSYTVLEASNGRAALDLLAQHAEIALVVTDVVLAGSMNGRLLAEEARRRMPGIKVLYMSGYSEDAIVHHGRLDRGVHFIQKPFRKSELGAKVREALETAADRGAGLAPHGQSRQ